MAMLNNQMVTSKRIEQSNPTETVVIHFSIFLGVATKKSEILIFMDFSIDLSTWPFLGCLWTFHCHGCM